MKTVRLILGDQLNYQHSWFKKINPDVTYALMEMRQETDYVMHHAQKIIGFFAAMYNFAAYLRKSGHRVIHLQINDPDNQQSLTANLSRILQRTGAENFEYLLPDEYRLDLQLKDFCKNLSIPSLASDTEHFYTTRPELTQVFYGKKTYLMESFYRQMRKKHKVLLDGDQPVGGNWNFDKENRQAFKNKHLVPPPFEFSHNYSDIWAEIQRSGTRYFGEPCEKNFPWPTSRHESLQVLRYFIAHLLPNFGMYQDAMISQNPYLFHSRLSFALNLKMLSPQEVVNEVEQAWRKNPEQFPLNAVEGFIRQILGWREYMRGIYWAEMPGFKQSNFFLHERPLPNWFWTGQTRMNCLRRCIGQSLEYSYAHHIQRLMVIGNFCLLAGIHPDQVDAWYLGVYIDAIEWVEITNTRGMSKFADGGKLATKPYVSGAAYINKMSDYCKACSYDKSQRHGEKACPFNSLYWNFFDRHQKLLARNPRLGMMFTTWQKMAPDERAKTLERAETYLSNIENL